MIYTVTFNPSLDYIITADALVAGEINRVTSELILSGGKGINVSIVFNHLGVENLEKSTVCRGIWQEI